MIRDFIFWWKFFRKHSKHAGFEEENHELFGIFVLRSTCKCGWKGEDHGQTPTGRSSAIEEFLDHLRDEGVELRG